MCWTFNVKISCKAARAVKDNNCNWWLASLNSKINLTCYLSLCQLSFYGDFTASFTWKSAKIEKGTSFTGPKKKYFAVFFTFFLKSFFSGISQLLLRRSIISSIYLQLFFLIPSPKAKAVKSLSAVLMYCLIVPGGGYEKNIESRM